MVATQEGHTETVKLLLDYNAQVGLFEEISALFLARRKGHSDIIQLLSAHDANTTPPQQGATPPDTQPGKETLHHKVQTIKKTQEEMCDEQRNMSEKEIQELQVSQQPHPSATAALHRVRKELKLSHLFQELLPLAAKWHNIGVLLDLPSELLEVIESDFSQPSDCLREMLKAWLRTTTPPPTWERVVDAVNRFDQNKAETICSKYCSP